MERRVRETVLEFFGNVAVWGTILVALTWLCSCEYGPDTLDLSYGRGKGEASADGFESEGENQAGWINFGWFLKPREFKLVGHELDANRDALPVFPTNQPPVILHDHPGETDSIGDQAAGIIDSANKADVNTLLFIMSILSLILGVAALCAAVYFVLKKKPNTKQA